MSIAVAWGRDCHKRHTPNPNPLCSMRVRLIATGATASFFVVAAGDQVRALCIQGAAVVAAQHVWHIGLAVGSTG